MYTNILFGIVTVTFLFSFGCVHRGSEKDSRFSRQPENWLSEAIKSVPRDYGNAALGFTNYHKARIIANAEDYNGMSTIMAEGADAVPWTYDLLSGEPFANGASTDIIFQETGFDFFALDQQIWQHRLADAEQEIGPRFGIAVGSFGSESAAQSLAEWLLELSLHHDTYNGVTYYYSWDNKPPGPREMLSNPFRMDAANHLNALAFVGDTLLVRKWPRAMPDQIDVHMGKRPSLWDDSGHRELAWAVGDEILTGVFLNPEFVAWGWSDSGYKRDEDPDRFSDYANSWGKLDPYSVAVIGSDIRGETAYTVVALRYSDPEAAGRNAEELKRRWNSAYLRIDSSGGSSMGQTPDVFEPCAKICAPLDTRSVVYDKSSVLAASCPATGFISDVHGATGPTLWRGLVERHELHFLVPDIAELTGGQ
ncbi:MAG: hypothetical protein OXC95_16680 [Dehalococcoidia bacterium]|nr:hypothetical protein [Dehalococcoidia bacterium]